MAGWRSIFWVNVPVGLAVWLGSRWVPEVGADRGGAAGEAASRKVDWPGTVLCVAMTGALTLALLQGSTWGWTSPAIVSLLAGSAVLFGAFCVVEKRSADPMVDVSILSEPTYAGSVMVGFIIQAALVGPMAFLSLYAQNIYRLTPAQTGLCFLPFSAAALIVAATCGGAVRRHRGQGEPAGDRAGRRRRLLPAHAPARIKHLAGPRSRSDPGGGRHRGHRDDRQPAGGLLSRRGHCRNDLRVLRLCSSARHCHGGRGRGRELRACHPAGDDCLPGDQRPGSRVGPGVPHLPGGLRSGAARPGRLAHRDAGACARS